jgi:hypothetical protein
LEPVRRCVRRAQIVEAGVTGLRVADLIVRVRACPQYTVHAPRGYSAHGAISIT